MFCTLHIFRILRKWKQSTRCKSRYVRTYVYTDVCGFPKDSGTCLSHQQRWYYDRSDGYCKKFDYSGCGGNDNRFVSEPACREACDALPPIGLVAFVSVVIRSPDVCRKTLLYCFLSFFINIPRSAQRTAIECIPLVGKARIIDPEITLTPPLIFTCGQKVRKLTLFSTSLEFEPPAFKNDTNFIIDGDRPMSFPSSVKLGPHTHP